MGRIKTWEEIIFGNVDKLESGCWNWKGYLCKHGYGKVTRKVPGTRKNTTHRAHREAWKIVNGEIPEGMFICHKCDNPRCCNPEHLFLGTAKDNNADMIKKDRHFLKKGNKLWKLRVVARDNKGRFT